MDIEKTRCPNCPNHCAYPGMCTLGMSFFDRMKRNGIKDGVIYIHGKGGNAQEADFYKPLFAECDVVGLDYKAEYPWDAISEFLPFFDEFYKSHKSVTVVANSIGAYFSMLSLPQDKIKKAYFISPIVNMEKLIENMLIWAGKTESDLKAEKAIPTNFGETLYWDYLTWVRSNPVKWSVPTVIIRGENDNMQSFETIKDFADDTDSKVFVMENGEHWFHTDEQMEFIKDIIDKTRLDIK